MFIKLELLKDIASKKQYFGKNLAEVFVNHWIENFDFNQFQENISYYLNRYIDGRYYVYFPDGSYFMCWVELNEFKFQMASITNPADFAALFYAENFPPF